MTTKVGQLRHHGFFTATNGRLLQKCRSQWQNALHLRTNKTHALVSYLKTIKTIKSPSNQICCWPVSMSVQQLDKIQFSVYQQQVKSEISWHFYTFKRKLPKGQPSRTFSTKRYFNWSDITHFRLELQAKMCSNVWLLSALLLSLYIVSGHTRSVINHEEDSNQENYNDRPIIGKVSFDFYIWFCSWLLPCISFYVAWFVSDGMI